MSIHFRDLPLYDLEGATRNFEQLTSFRFKGSFLEGPLDEPTIKKESITTTQLAKPEAWKKLSTLTYKNAWEDEVGIPGEYRKDPFGNVELRGALKNGTPAKEAFTLPSGYRPKGEKNYIVDAGSNTGLVRVFATGVTELFSLAGEAKTIIYLDQVRFSVE